MSEPREVELVCSELNPALDLLRSLGLRLDVIYPADDPHSAELSGSGQRIRLTSRPGEDRPPSALPPFRPRFVLIRASADGGEGRAGMRYRDLIPDRLGGRYIASHITIPEGGPVADWVHYHAIAVQVIVVREGWVRVVYEDQGEPFVMEAGDLVLQPPLIRHRVLESSPGLEVIEIGCPALHATFADHDLDLPTGTIDAGRDFGGQRFLRHRASETPWTPFCGGEAQETALGSATGGVADARIVRPGDASTIAFPTHRGELVFGFVLDGSAELRSSQALAIGPADAFVIPPDEAWSIGAMSDDFRLLHVTTALLT